MEPSDEHRCHDYAVALSKRLFFHREHGIVHVLDPIRVRDAAQYGLEAILMYSISVTGTSLRWLTFSMADEPLPHQEVLLQAWSKGGGLRGFPDIVRVSRQLCKSAPTLAQELAAFGVVLEVPPASDKTLPGALRASQALAGQVLGWSTLHATREVPAGLPRLNADAHSYHQFRAQPSAHGGEARQTRERVSAWLQLPSRQPHFAPAPTGPLWEGGEWLRSWEKSVPPDQGREFIDARDGGKCLVESDRVLPTDALSKSEPYRAEMIGSILKCWPNPLKEVAAMLGVTLRELKWYLGGQSGLGNAHELERLVGIDYGSSYDVFEFLHGVVLSGASISAKTLEEALTTITHGGDAIPYEAVPSEQPADPSWRYFLIETHGVGASVVVIPRGNPLADRMDSLVLNYEGIRSVPDALYLDLVGTVGKACLTPLANTTEVADFNLRHSEYWSAV